VSDESHLVGYVLVRLDISGNLLLRSKVITPFFSQSELGEMSPSTKRLDGSGYRQTKKKTSKLLKVKNEKEKTNGKEKKEERESKPPFADLPKVGQAEHSTFISLSRAPSGPPCRWAGRSIPFAFGPWGKDGK